MDRKKVTRWRLISLTYLVFMGLLGLAVLRSGNGSSRGAVVIWITGSVLFAIAWVWFSSDERGLISERASAGRAIMEFLVVFLAALAPGLVTWVSARHAAPPTPATLHGDAFGVVFWLLLWALLGLGYLAATRMLHWLISVSLKPPGPPADAPRARLESLVVVVAMLLAVAVVSVVWQVQRATVAMLTLVGLAWVAVGTHWGLRAKRAMRGVLIGLLFAAIPVGVALWLWR